MKVLFVNDDGAPAGAAECNVLSLRDELRRRRHDARWFASNADTRGLPNRADTSGFGPSGRLRTPLQSANPRAARARRRTLAGFLTDRQTVVSMGRAASTDARDRFGLPDFAARFERIYREFAAR